MATKTVGTKRHAPYQGRLAAWYRYRQGVTNVNGACSVWKDATNQGRDLLQATAASRPTILSDGSLSFDGSNDYLQAAFTLAQQASVFMAFTQVTWTSGAFLFDGQSGQFSVLQNSSSPNLAANAGSALSNSSAIALNTRGVLGFIGNGASSSYIGCGGAAPATVTGNAGANSPGGFTLGASRIPGNYSNIIVREVLIYSGAISAPEITTILRYLGRVGNVGGI